MLRFATVVAGQILYDGVDISRVPRKRLRQGLTIIPQEATLLKGTVAYNLDPTGQVPRDKLQSALDLCRGIAALGAAAAAATSAGPETLTLDAPVAPLGDNFSHGQRQVLSLCRALVRDARLMLLDEATASMDYETDRGIQAVLRTWIADKGAATLVTIAHRLRTIIDYDTVVVLGGGRVLEYVSSSNDGPVFIVLTLAPVLAVLARCMRSGACSSTWCSKAERRPSWRGFWADGGGRILSCCCAISWLVFVL
jgi:ABC-type multidrug transport system fused ATPase/permease subunit